MNLRFLLFSVALLTTSQLVFSQVAIADAPANVRITSGYEKTAVSGILAEHIHDLSGSGNYVLIWNIKNKSGSAITFDYRVNLDAEFKRITLPAGHVITEERKVVDPFTIPRWILEVRDSSISPDAVKKLTKTTLAAAKKLSGLAGTSKLRRDAKALEESLEEIRAAALEYPLIKIKNIEVAEDAIDVLRRKVTPIHLQKKAIKRLISQITVIHTASSNLH